MARFVLKFKLRGRPNRERPDRTVERGEVVLGSRPLADVYVADRLVPQEALVFHFDGSQLTMDVRGRLAGVFVDGHPVQGRGPLRSGATVQVGHALVECSVDAAKGECTLTANEQYLPQIVDGIALKAKVGKPFALVDPGPQEHRWGRTPILRRGNWIAVAAGFALLAAFPLLRNTEAMTRGELHHAHAPGAKGGPTDCAGCHEPFSSNYDAKCSACHEGFDSVASHPYEANSGLACTLCHGEHLGATADIMPPMSKSESGWPRTCLRCHEGTPFPAAEPPAETFAKARARTRDQRGTPFARQLLVDGFSHGDHRRPRSGGFSTLPGGLPAKAPAPVACGECHKALAPDAANDPIPTAEFASVTYSKCLECHADWRVAVHGRDEKGAACYACHAQAAEPAAITPALKSVDLAVTGSKWVLLPRSHDYRKDECLVCHVLAKSSTDQRTPIGEKVFRHDHHLPTVAPAEGREAALAKDCRACHDAVAKSETLAGTSIVNTSECAKCHVDSEPTPVPVKEGATRRVPDMFHRVHTMDAAMESRSALRYASSDTLAHGCLSCHVPSAGTAPMGFREGAKDCKACHTGHENLGEGKCVLCHVDRAPGMNREMNGRLEFRRSEPGIFNRKKAVEKTTAAMKPFDHASPGHAKHDCALCHDPAGVDDAPRVLAVQWPAFDDASCVNCHLRERFHR